MYDVTVTAILLLELAYSTGNPFNHASYTTCLHFLQNIFQWS